MRAGFIKNKREFRPGGRRKGSWGLIFVYKKERKKRKTSE